MAKPIGVPSRMSIISRIRNRNVIIPANRPADHMAPRAGAMS